MKRSIVTTAVLLTLCASTARSQSTRPASQAVEPETRSFDLTPAAPPTPALKYQFFFNFAQRIPGNAAPMILDAALLMGPTAPDTAEKAIDAYDAKDFKTFDSLADSLDLTAMWDELGMAMRRANSDFDPPTREMAERTMLPHLQSIRSMAWLIRVRALRLTEQGKVDEALESLRLGYELADKVTDPVLVSALVSAGCTQMMSDTLARVMTHPASPNLYWALAEMPSRRPTLRRSWDAEHEWMFVCHPRLARLRAGEEPSAEQWRSILIDEMAPFYTISKDYKTVGQRPHPDPIKDAPPELLKRAQQAYAESHHVTPEQAAKIDPAITLGHFYVQQWQLASDGVAKLRGLPYPILLAKTHDYRQHLIQLKKEQPTNPFFELLSDMHRVVDTFARTDRQIAALTAVEALRSYAATHDSHLPARLDDVTDTPIPNNPYTDRPFEYRVDSDGVATLADTQSESHLTYTIRIRK